jgi:hypothetical protein
MLEVMEHCRKRMNESLLLNVEKIALDPFVVSTPYLLHF